MVENLNIWGTMQVLLFLVLAVTARQLASALAIMLGSWAADTAAADGMTNSFVQSARDPHNCGRHRFTTQQTTSLPTSITVS